MLENKTNTRVVRCAVCGDPIENMNDAFVQWLSDMGAKRRGLMAAEGLRVVHHLRASPLRHHRPDGCYYPEQNPSGRIWVMDHHLRAFPDGGRRLARCYGWEDTLAVVETIEPAYAALAVKAPS